MECRNTTYSQKCFRPVSRRINAHELPFIRSECVTRARLQLPRGAAARIRDSSDHTLPIDEDTISRAWQGKKSFGGDKGPFYKLRLGSDHRGATRATLDL